MNFLTFFDLHLMYKPPKSGKYYLRRRKNMTNMTFNNEKKHNRARALRIYSVLVICMLVFSGAAFFLKKADDTKVSEKPTQIVAAKKTDVKKTIAATTERKTTQAPTTATAAPTTTVPKTQNTIAEFFVMPLGGIMTKQFSDEKLQFDETYNDWRLHQALDIAAERGTEVHASGDGKVSKVYEDSLLGNVVVIDHGNGIIAHYCGLNAATVKEGQAVTAGEIIGGVGQVPCEKIEQPHLHFAVQKDGRWIDPIEGLGIGVE
jgi:murein DD-endopeptidase MepM/ murein hydrolase activator NlpD